MSYHSSLNLIVFLLVAAISDCPFFKIPIWFVFPTLITAGIYHFSLKGLVGLLLSIGGVSIGIAGLMIPT